MTNGPINNVPGEGVEEWLWQDNLRLRAELLKEMPTLSLAEVAARAGTPGAGDTETVRLWLRERRVVALEVDGQELFPAFQFEGSGQPRPVVGEILAVLLPDRTPWQVVFWFMAGNGWLGGAAPCERLDECDAVLMAAQQSADGAVG